MDKTTEMRGRVKRIQGGVVVKDHPIGPLLCLVELSKIKALLACSLSLIIFFSCPRFYNRLNCCLGGRAATH